MCEYAHVSKAAEVDWNDLRYLRVTLQHGSLARAARALRVQHTTVGRRIDALERTIGAALVIRGPDGVRPTPIAVELAPLLDDVDRAVTSACALAVARRAFVRLATPSGFAAILGDAIEELRASEPDVSIEIVSGARPIDLRRGEADLALRVGPVDDPDLVVKNAGAVGWSLYASKRYLERAARVDLTDLRGHDVIGFDRALAASPAAQWMEAHARGTRVVLRSREMVDMRDAAAKGAGLALLPCVLADPEPKLVRITPAVLASRPIAIAYRKDARISGAVRVVVRALAGALAQHAPQLSGTRRR